MADEADRAQVAVNQHLLLALAARGTQPVGESRTNCEECGEPIPESRRLAVPGVRLCIECQQEADNG